MGSLGIRVSSSAARLLVSAIRRFCHGASSGFWGLESQQRRFDELFARSLFHVGPILPETGRQIRFSKVTKKIKAPQCKKVWQIRLSLFLNVSSKHSLNACGFLDYFARTCRA